MDLKIYQMPCQGHRYGCVANSRTNKPHDDYGPEFLETLELGNEMNGDRCAHTADCTHKVSKSYTFIAC